MPKENKRDSAQLLIEWVQEIKMLSNSGINTISKRKKNDRLTEIRGACEAILITLNNTVE